MCCRLCFLQDLSLKCNEEGKSLSTETFTKVSLTNLRRQAVPDLASDLGMNLFKKVFFFYQCLLIYLCRDAACDAMNLNKAQPQLLCSSNHVFLIRTGCRSVRACAVEPLHIMPL